MIKKNGHVVSAESRGEKLSLIILAKESLQGPVNDKVVDEVRVLINLIPVILCFSPYWALYYQTVSSFITQGQ